MVKTKKSFTEGGLFFKITAFAIPIMLTGVLQVFYNMADRIVVGKFSGDPLALAAVGSVGSLTTLIVNLTMGVAVGAGIVTAQHFGAKRYDEVSRASHTAVFFSLFAGLFMGAVGFFIAKPVLILIGTKPELVSGATLYFRILMVGMPASMVYNFSAAILRSVGDSKTPLIILSSSGLLNVLLNLVFVLFCGMSVEGVALATIASQYASAFFVVLVLVKRKNECYAIRLKELKLHKDHLLRMLRIGIPAGLTSSVYSIANIVLTGAINTFPTEVVSANSIAGSVDGFTYTAMNCYQQASMTFTGQNFGARKNDRIKKVFFFSMIQVSAIGILVGQVSILFGEEISMLYIEASDPNKDTIIMHTIEIMRVMLNTYFLCGIMEVCSGALRGLGHSTITMVISFIFACGVRISYIYLVFFNVESLNTIGELYYAFPISWITTIIAFFITIAVIWRKMGIWKSKRLVANEELREPQNA